ncbi:hypothetical protein N1851_028685 [Merluccius polli]|uniref:Uncharacterized protein n=1 Tax=Merluccius polli TaxID=89951 RepID=A0AA47M8D2_MERPO|nr:hypothetical protein N1851_028685 [Merluccius polli]
MLIQAETCNLCRRVAYLVSIRPGNTKHGVLPRLLWPLLVYRVSVSTVEGLERKINTYLRRWLGIPRSFCSIGLYSTDSKLQLPVISMVEEYKATKTCQAMMLRDSQDARVGQADIEVRTDRKWSTSRALREAEDCLQHAGIVGSVAQGRLGLGCSTRVSWVKAKTKERRGMVHREVRKAEDERRRVKAVSMNKQGSWTKCPSCTLCGRPANLEHVISSRRSSLADGKFQFPIDQILTQLAAGQGRVQQQRRGAKESWPQQVTGRCERTLGSSSNSQRR